ncbi:MAG: ParA family protein, partial [Proteobacteria bacterium]|nr:ParA family protein [Pseudomonadota bacterium]
NLNKNLQIIGLLRVMFDPRITLQQQVSEQLKAHFGDKVFDTVIPRNVRLAEAPSYGLPGVVFDPSARGSQAFVAFAEELVKKMPPASAFAQPAPPVAAPPAVVPAAAPAASGVSDENSL